MDNIDFQIVVDDTPERLTLALRGELDLATAPEVREAVAAHADGRREIVVDLSGLAFMDSTGLRLLLELNGEGDGPPVCFVAPPADVGKVLDLTGVRDLLRWAPGGADGR